MYNSLVFPETIYFATHVAIADNRLFDREWYLIEETIKQQGYGDDVRDNVINIVLDRPEKITLEQIMDVLLEMPVEVRMFAVKFGLRIAYEDRSFGDREYAYFQTLRTNLRIDRVRFEALMKETKAFLSGTQSGECGDQIVIKAKSLYERYENCLFSAEVYSDAVKEMSQIAKEDIAFASKRVEKVAQVYRACPQNLKKQTDNVINLQSRLNDAEEKKQLISFRDELLKSIDQSLERSNESMNILRERQAAASNSFTISFMGRTKAGKSTLHSVLLGGLNNEFIGRGSERTTRYNYIYDFQGMRIIDTPGIGAPGGKSDTEIAQEVADESDLICYVVTTDSIQETEFNFLKKLKDRNKPVLILLNKKDNITRSEKKLQAFLDNPLGWYENDGEDSIQGHIDRINTYVLMNHDFHNFSIVPVHLLAAKLALKEPNTERKEKYLEGSRINVFLKTLTDMISKSGTIQRSQTIYNSAIYHLEEDLKSAVEQKTIVETLRKELKKNTTETLKRIKAFGDNKRNDFITSFNSAFDSFLKEDVRKFANQHYDTTNKELNDDWNKFLSTSDLEKRLELSYRRNWEQYQNRVQDILTDSEEDLNFSMEFGALSNVKVKKIVDVKFALESFGAIFGVIGVLLASNPVGWVFMGLAAVVAIVGLFVKSKDQRIDAAKGNLYDSLVENVNKMRQKNLTELLKKYDASRKNVYDQINNYNETIIMSLIKIYQSLDELTLHLTETEQELNNAYGARIANYMMKTAFYNINDEKSLAPLCVERVFKESIKLTDSRLFIQPMYVDVESMNDILQEKLYIN